MCSVYLSTLSVGQRSASGDHECATCCLCMTAMGRALISAAEECPRAKVRMVCNKNAACLPRGMQADLAMMACIYCVSVRVYWLPNEAHESLRSSKSKPTQLCELPCSARNSEADTVPCLILNVCLTGS